MARLQSAIERWYREDPFAYAALCAEDVTYFAPNTHGRLEGLSVLKALYTPLAGKINVPRFEILNPKIDFHGDIGILTYNLNEYASEGPPSYRWNATEVYRRTDTEWRIIHAHWSPIPKPQST